MAGRKRRGKPYWAEYSREDLLDLRICDLGLKLTGTWLEDCIAAVQRDLQRRELKVRPKFWLSEEWFSPDGVLGVAIPFYLAHPRLMRLERSQMLEVEGSTRQECIRLLRHELGHVIDHAFGLSDRQKWRKLFGDRTKPYPNHYRPNPLNKRFVQHLDYWYAQAHPDEDFAETFAVWLAPRSNWRKRYQGWPALKKLLYVDEIMKELAGVTPENQCRHVMDPVSKLRKTLRGYYGKKKAQYGADSPDVYDADLKKLFSDNPKHKNQPTAARFLRENRVEIREMVSRWTGEYQFTLDVVMKEMIQRATELRLRAVGSKKQLAIDFALLLTVKTMHNLYRERHWVPM